MALHPFKVIGANSNNTSIAIDIHSADEANSSQNLNHAVVPGVESDIIRDLLLDRGQPISDIDVRLATLTAILSSPIPSATPNPLQSIPSTIVSPTSPESLLTTPITNIEILATTITPTTSNSQTSTSTSTIVTSPTSTITATKLPAATNTPTVIFATKTPTNQPSNTSTLQPTKTSTASATNTTSAPTNTPTMLSTNTPTTQPTNSPTNQPTNTPTITLTFQPTNTPTTQTTSTPTPQFTNTPTIQNTNTPTIQPTSTSTIQPTSTSTIPPTFTPTPIPTNTPTTQPTLTPTLPPACSFPLPGSIDYAPPPNGFVEAIYPSNGATDVPMSINHITIFFNQPMEIGTGGHGVQNIGRYLLQNLSNNDKLDITDVTYDPLTFVAQVYFSKASNWSILTTYQFTIDKEIANDPTCAVKQDVHIQIEFTTDNGSVVIHDNLVFLESQT